MTKPLISVVVPIYNAEIYLVKCIESLINQVYRNIQIILVNDGSQDKSLDICKRFKELDSRVLVIDQENQGVSKARSAGIEAAVGEYIGFVDSDDFIDPEMYQVLLSKIRAEGSQCATLIDFTIRPVSKNIINAGGPVDNLEAIGELFLLRFPTSMWAYLYKAELVKDIILSDNICFFEDFEFNYNFLKKCEKVSLCDGGYYGYNSNPQSINQQEINSKKTSCLSIYDKLKNDISSFHNEVLNDKALFFRAHFVVSMILSFSSSSKEKQKFFCFKLYESIKSFEGMFFFSKHVPFSYKLLIVFFSISPVFTVNIIRFFKFFR